MTDASLNPSSASCNRKKTTQSTPIRGRQGGPVVSKEAPMWPSQLMRTLHPTLEKWALCWGLQARDEVGTASFGLGCCPARLHPGLSAVCLADSQQPPHGL